jgi:hypothetical protein
MVSLFLSTIATPSRVRAAWAVVLLLMASPAILAQYCASQRPGASAGSAVAPSMARSTDVSRAAAEIIQLAGGTNKTMFLWGWRDSLYVETQLPRALRTHSVHILNGMFGNNPLYKEQLVEEFRKDRPGIVVDVIHPSSFRYDDREKYGLHLFPELERLIGEQYNFIGEIDGLRIYRLR